MFQESSFDQNLPVRALFAFCLLEACAVGLTQPRSHSLSNSLPSLHQKRVSWYLRDLVFIPARRPMPCQTILLSSCWTRKTVMTSFLYWNLDSDPCTSLVGNPIPQSRNRRFLG